MIATILSAIAPILRPLDRYFAARGVWLRWLPAFLWYSMIFTLTSTPGMDGHSTQSALAMFGLGDWNAVLRSGAHVVVFGALAVLVLGAVRRGLDDTRPTARRRDFLLAGAITAVLAFSDEFHQTMVPGRHGRAIDMAYNLAGIALALATVRAASWRK